MTREMNEKDLLVLSSDDSGDEEEGGPRPIQRMAIIDACNVMYGCAGMSFNAKRPNPINQMSLNARRPNTSDQEKLRIDTFFIFFSFLFLY